MKKRVLALAVACLLGVVCFAGCNGGKTEITVSEDGYLIVNGDVTDVKVNQDGKDGTNGTNGKDGADGQDGTDGKDGTNGASAYELYLKENPMYKGTEAQWLDDLANGKLATRKDYSIVSYGRNLAATVEKGTVSYTVAGSTEGATVSLSSAVLALNTPVVLPLGEASEWNILFSGTIGATGGQFLTNYANGTEGRVYFGVNEGNQILFMGVYAGTSYKNYCWSVDKATLGGEHDYVFSYKGGEYLLTIDGGEAKRFSTINIGQSNITSVANPAVASADLTNEIRAVTGQSFVKLTNIGTTTQLSSVKIKSLHATTSSIYGYEELSAHPLRNKTVYFLGSSVTRGHGGDTDGTSFADIGATIAGYSYRKEAISGTYLAVSDGRTNSYVERLELLDLTKKPDVLVFQLSTNDFSNNIPVGNLGNGTASTSFDKSTVTGAIEYIVAKVHESSPNTKIVLYTCTVGSAYAKYNEYKSYIEGTLRQVAEKWAGTLTVLDLFHEDYVAVATYMQTDGVHPNKACFAHLYTPLFINCFTEILK